MAAQAAAVRAAPVVPATGSLEAWVASVFTLTEAAEVVWCDGTVAELHRLTELLIAQGTAVRLPPCSPGACADG